MSSLNLLSPPKKKTLQMLVKFLFFKEMLEFSMFTCALLGIAHVLAWIMLTFTLNGLAESSVLVQRENTSLNQQIRSANSAFAEIARSGEGFLPLTPKLVELAIMLPGDIKLSTLAFNRAEQTLALGGTAETREALLHFQQVLAGFPWIKEMKAPHSQLFQKDNIKFEITATVQGFPSLPSALVPAKNRPGGRVDID